MSAAIDVSAPSTGDGGGIDNIGHRVIRIADPDSPDTSNISAGEAPLSVILNAEVSGFGIDIARKTCKCSGGLGLTVTREPARPFFHTYQIPERSLPRDSYRHTPMAAARRNHRVRHGNAQPRRLKRIANTDLDMTFREETVSLLQLRA
ncbi:MAG: hypothetical protein R3E58_00785 [Phycisphaerae bacterium]